jgi:demethylmenaquinone methyltransferase/2-methoxy-6-polyprenyl-1,4-benzoquinol methylase
LASGTGDLSIAFAETSTFAGHVLGIDFSPAMVARAQEKAMARRLASRVHFREGDALATGEPDGSYDVVSIGFGLRNFIDRDQGLRECWRVLAPGGRLVVVDFFRKEELPPIRLYLDLVIPLLGRIISRSRSAYTYLRESRKEFWTPDELAQRLLATGFREVITKPLTLGIAHCVVGVKR